jgi:peptide/nickel transport system permease protein
MLPNFWMALLLLLGLALVFKWSPPLIYSLPWDNLGNHLQMIALPVLLLVWEYGSHIMRVTRAGVLAAMQEEYIVAARARGLSERQIVVRHALPAAAAPIVTVMGLQFGVLLGGTLIMESIFGLPGLGRGLVDAALARDFPVVQSYVTLLVFAVLAVNLMIDLLYRAIDPRISFSRLQVGR